jgi:hypothetical protein
MSRRKRPPEPEQEAAPAGPAPEFSRPIDLTDLAPGGLERDLEASAEECAGLARRFELEALAALSASLRILPLSGGVGARVEGRFQARLTRLCVISLEPFDAEVAESFKLDLLPAELIDNGGAVEQFTEEDVEPFAGPSLDLGELVAQYLALALDPHPRRPGVALDAALPGAAEPARDGRAGPFAALGELRRKM